MEVKKAVASIPSSSEAQLNESDEYESNSEEEEIQRELADVSFEEIQKARSNGFVAIKAKVKQEKKGGRANKNRLMEISSKKPVRRHREVVQVPKKVL
ncbi:hypothetical protein GIB67_028313 [Kingdonia uniflora]|uniref:Uncharacterized protein n=1 Tax=Kingdonia uniflora TaxID=39325 RepID=A0A7J7MHU6_9MAGN|nr:hypothetical protein GIB67_028313 [Kingdonia uniflora]